MPGGLNGTNLKQGLITAAPMFNAMAAGYASGRGPYAYMDQGAALMQQNLKAKRDEEAAAAAAAAFAGLVPGGMGAAGMSSKGGASSGGGFAPVPIDPSSPDAIAADTMTALGRGNDWLKYSNQGATRNDPLDAKLVDAMSFLPQMGITMDVISGGQEAAGEGGARKGSVRHDHGMAADVDFYKDGRKLDWNNPADLPLLTQIVQTAKSRGVTGIGAGDDYMGAGRFHVGFGDPAVWGKGGQSANAPAWLVDAYNGAPSGDVTMSAKGEGAVPTGPVDPLADPYIQKLMQVMAMPGLTPEMQSVVQLQLQTRIGQLTAPDPNADEDAARQRRARDAEMLGYGRGTPEWNQYVISGDVASPQNPIEVGGVLLDPTGQNVIFDSREPPKPEAPTTKNVTLADGSEVMVQWNPETKVWDAAPIPEGGTTGAGEKLTESQSKLTLFQTLQTETAPVLLELEKQFDPANLKDPSLASIPIAGNYFTSPEYQMYSTAASAWAEGALRISTGAASTQPEIERIVKVYFAQPGDTPQTVAFKASMRQMYDRAVNNALGKPNGGGSLMLPSEFADVVGGQMAGGATPAPTVPPPGGVLKFDANGNVIP